MWHKQLLMKLGGMYHPESPLVIAATGLGFSVLAGLFGGVVYIISQGFHKRKRCANGTCNNCGAKLDEEPKEIKTAVCVKCNRRYCSRSSCIKKLQLEQWICNHCQPVSWFSGLSKFLPLNQTVRHENMTEAQGSTSEEKEKRQEIRDFIEKLVEALLGGDLDNVSVKRIYEDPKYEDIFSRYHSSLSAALSELGSALHVAIASKWYLPISGESPCTAHASLKTLIQKFIREAAELPKLETASPNPEESTSHSNVDKTYEDLLATAIINKVVQNYQENKPLATSSRSSSSLSKRGECFLGQRNLDGLEDASISSLEDFPSYTKYVDPTSLTIHKSIEEVTTSEDEEEVDAKSIRQNDWQENWYLRKRKFGNNSNGTQSPVPVPMLVPNPAADAKVLIGDRDAEDTTDLSDVNSDYEDSAEPTSLNAVIVNSKTLIGGKNPLDSLAVPQETISEDGSTDASDLIQEKDDIVKAFNSIHENEDNVDLVESTNRVLIEKNSKDEELMSLESNTEKDSEYTEKYATLPKKIQKNPTPAPRQSKISDYDFYKEHLLSEPSKTDNGDSGVTSDEDEKQKIFKGTYSEREKEKWNHGVELNNNPYSKSNLESRLSNRSSSSSLNSFSTDFCIKTSANPAGGPKRDFEVAESSENSKQNEENVFTATPALVNADEEEFSLETAKWDLSSESDCSIERTYNVNTGTVIKKAATDKENIEGIKYAAQEFDENQNDLEKNFLSDFIDTEKKIVSSPLPNHFQILTDIANENPAQYDNDPISPPAEFKSLNSLTIETTDETNKNAKVIAQMEINDQGKTVSDEIEREIANLKEKKVVKNLLEVYPYVVEQNANNKSIEQIPVYNGNAYESENNIEIVETSREVPSVKEIKEIFNADSSYKPEVYSLTARSIPIHVREVLKQEANLQENITVEINSEPSPEFPKAKSKIEFFESIARN